MAEDLNKETFESVEASMIEGVLSETAGLGINEQRALIEGQNFEALVEALLLARVITPLASIQQDIVLNLQNESGLSDNEMIPVLNDYDLIAQLDQNAILRSGAQYGNQFKSQLLKGLNAGQTVQQMLTETNIPNFKFNWNITAYNTAIEQFEASATAAVFENDPRQRFKLAGPLDDKTRCECRAVLNGQPKEGWTKGEIDRGAATKIVKRDCPEVKPESQVYSWVGRGGFNCRHAWRAVE